VDNAVSVDEKPSVPSRRGVVDWAEISAISTGLDEQREASTTALAEIRLLMRTDTDRDEISLHFLDGERLVTHAPGGTSTDPYDAVEVADKLFLVGVCHSEHPRTSTTWVLDLVACRATRVRGRLPTIDQAGSSLLDRVHARRELSAVTAEFTPLSIVEISGHPAEPKGAPHTRTRELIGKRIRYTYGNGGIYEHVYLNENLFSWHCPVIRRAQGTARRQLPLRWPSSGVST
jgi:hypothetical protein